MSVRPFDGRFLRAPQHDAAASGGMQREPPTKPAATVRRHAQASVLQQTPIARKEITGKASSADRFSLLGKEKEKGASG